MLIMLIQVINGNGTQNLTIKYLALTLTQKGFKLLPRLKKMLDMDLKYIQVDYTMK